MFSLVWFGDWGYRVSWFSLDEDDSTPWFGLVAGVNMSSWSTLVTSESILSLYGLFAVDTCHRPIWLRTGDLSPTGFGLGAVVVILFSRFSYQQARSGPYGLVLDARDIPPHSLV